VRVTGIFRAAAIALVCLIPYWLAKRVLGLAEFFGTDRFCRFCKTLRATVFWGVLLLWIDPFHFQAETLRASQDFSDRLDAAKYNPRSAGDLAVIEIDDGALLERFSQTTQAGHFEWQEAVWPQDFTFWSSLLGRVLQHDPAAVYIDVAFSNLRTSLADASTPAGQTDSDRAALEAAEFARVIAGDESGRRIPVVLGSIGRIAARQPPLAGCKDAARDGEPTSVLPILACAAHETVFFDAKTVHDGRGYPLRISWTNYQPDNPAISSMVESRSAAVALAELGCRSLLPKPLGCSKGQPGWMTLDALQSLPLDEALIPRWAFTSAGSVTAETSAAGCRHYDKVQFIQMMIRIGRLVWSEAMAGVASDDYLHTICLPFPEITASRVLEPSGPAPRALLDKLLRGRIVLIGDGRDYSPDHVATPLQSSVPGVVLHATALETLLTAGPDFPFISDASQSWRNKVEWTARVAILGLAIALERTVVFLHGRTTGLIARRSRHPAAQLPEFGGVWLKRLVHPISLFLIYLFLVGVLLSGLSVTGLFPSNWLLLLLLSVVLAIGQGDFSLWSSREPPPDGTGAPRQDIHVSLGSR
jgi:CHASE2 domain-containing sensor protein